MPLSKVLLNAVSAKMGGAANYLRAVATELHGRQLPFEVVLCVPPGQLDQFRTLTPRFRVISPAGTASAVGRLWFDQVSLRRLLRRERVDVLFSTANLGVLNAPCRQILLVRNSLYFNDLYLRTLYPLKPVRTRLGEHARRSLTLASIRAADQIVTPSAALRDEMVPQLGRLTERIVVNPYGVDAARFAGDERGASPKTPARLLFTSLYSEHKNLGTLLRAVERLDAEGTAVRLLTTADPRGPVPQSTVQAVEAELTDSLARRHLFESPGPLVANAVGALYATADLFVYPSLVESFGHPLLEAMAAKLPIVAADVPINRELCGDSATYFSPQDAGDCARQIARVLGDENLRRQQVLRGSERVRSFTWSSHVDRLLLLFNAGNSSTPPS